MLSQLNNSCLFTLLMTDITNTLYFIFFPVIHLIFALFENDTISKWFAVNLLKREENIHMKV